MNTQDGDTILRRSQLLARGIASAARIAVKARHGAAGRLCKELESGIEWDAVPQKDRRFVMALARLKILEILNDLGADEVRGMVEDN